MGAAASASQKKILEEELKKPLDASDVTSLADAKAEVERIRNLIVEMEKIPEVVVAVDGSEISEALVDVGLKIMPEGCSLNVITISDSTKTHLPSEMQPQQIVDRFSAKLVSQLPESKFKVMALPKGPGQHTRSLVVNYCNDKQARKTSCLIMGMHGRKAKKHKPQILGKTSDYSMRGAFCSVCIVKSDAHVPKKGETAVFVVAMDGSNRSCAAYDLAVAMKKKSDKLIAMYVDTGGDIEEKVKAKAPDAVAVEKVGGKSIAKTILEYVDTGFAEQVHFLVIGADGMGSFQKGKKAFGSVSDRLVRDCKCSVIVESVKSYL